MTDYDPLIYPSKSVAMQRLLDFRQRGYPLHVSGEVQTDKVWRFVQKMSGRYRVHLTRDQRRRARERGEGVAVLILFPAELQYAWCYWLLVAPHGFHPAHAQEPLRDSRSGKRADRLGWGAEFEVVHRTRPRAHGGGQVMTWQMQQERFRELQGSVQAAARQNSPRQAREILAVLRKQPGFSGIRAQTHHLLREFRSDWRRHHRHPMPQLPRIPYLGRRPDACTSTLSQLLQF